MAPPALAEKPVSLMGTRAHLHCCRWGDTQMGPETMIGWTTEPFVTRDHARTTRGRQLGVAHHPFEIGPEVTSSDARRRTGRVIHRHAGDRAANG